MDESRIDDAPSVRKPPHNLEAEQALLGALLTDNSKLDRVGPLIGAHFFDPLHGAAFDAITEMVTAGQAANPITMQARFQHAGPDGRPAWVYLGQLCAMAGPSPAGYASVIIEHSQRRHLILAAEELWAAAFDDPDARPKRLIDDIERTLAGISEVGARGAEVAFSDAVQQSLQSASSAFERGGRMAGIPTGLVDLDAKLGGMQSSDLVILAGRPAIGKSALATNIAVNVASGWTDQQTGEVHDGGHVHFFSQEMSAEQLASRVLAQRAEVSSDALRRGSFDMQTFQSQLVPAARALQRLPITIDETGGIPLSRLAARARRTKRRHDTKLIVIDYLQLMGADGGRRSENRVQELTAITTGLKALAKELNVPILALSQLSRRVEERADKRPQLSDLRESGSIEQDADVVMFVYRDEYYLSREQPPDDDDQSADLVKWRDRMAKAAGKAEVIVAKHRHGPTGIVHLQFDAAVTRFSNLARGDRE